MRANSNNNIIKPWNILKAFNRSQGGGQSVQEEF